MKFSTRTRYATRALLDLALHEAGKPVVLKDIAARQQISLKYLEQLMKGLITTGLIRSARGPRGGIRLNKPAADIKLSQIFQIFEGSCAPVECIDKPGVCNRSGFCAARDVWGEVKDAIGGVLESITLQDLVERQRVKTPAKSMYYI